MNVIVDMIFAAPFIALLAPGMRWLFWVAFASGIFVAELFSPFSFGVMALALGAGWLIARALMKVFDTSSLSSISIAFLAGILCETFLIMLLFAFEKTGLSSALVLRSGVFVIRQFLAGMFLFALIMGLRAAFAVGIYAMAEEKNPFA